ncbi:cytochrome P450 81Q32 [Ziziphus jujuba]|uniref:Cytochrome P450 81Q32 n=2 Tax=Ziziphus jujuba TaxID=326968 RepID=A0A6P4BCT8_ZIZJJ|nr:cytochrome P450 81Q32 [Ziziphus jujuba]
MASLFFFYILLFSAVYVFTKHLFHKIQNLPPSPFPLPVIGHLYLLERPLHRTLSKLAGRYGPILFLKLGSRPVLVVSSSSAAEECLAKNDIIFANRPRLMVGKYLGYNFTSVAWAPYGDHWRNLRRISSLELLSSHRLQMLSGIRLEEVKLLLRRLFEKQGVVVDMRQAFFELTLNIMMRMIAGKRYYGDEVVEDLKEAMRFREIQEETVRLSGKSNLGDFLPFVRWIGGSKRLEKSLMELQRKRDGFLQDLIEEHRRTASRIANDCCSPSPSPSKSKERRKTMLEVLLSLQQMEPEYYKDEIIRGLMLVLLLGGTDTTINTLQWSLSLLLNHPEILKKAQDEIDNRVGHGRLVDESDVAQLPYLKSIINETLRMYPPIPLLLPHESSEESTVGGFRIPRGTTLLVNIWAIQNDPTIWVDPTSFKPERYIEAEGMRNDKLRLMPFGSGRRGCPGEGLGMRVVGLVLGLIIQCFNWERVSQEKMVDMSEGNGLTLPKSQPLQAKCWPRSTMSKLVSQID